MLELLKARFRENKNLHIELNWLDVEKRLLERPASLEILRRMEESGGEPDTIGYDEKTGKLIFCDCSKESPSGRRSLCYDEKALQRRTKNPPSGSAEQKAKGIGISIMTEELYRRLQSLGEFDLKTSSWIATPDDIRGKGGALFVRGVTERCLHFTMGRTRTIPHEGSGVIFSYNFRFGENNNDPDKSGFAENDMQNMAGMCLICVSAGNSTKTT